MLGCFFPTLLGRSHFDYFGIFYFPKSTFKVVPGETWVNEHTNFHMTLQLQSNQQMDDIQGVFSRGLQYYWCGNLAFERGERMWFISVKIAPHYHNIINPEQGQPHLTLLGRIKTAVSHFILNHFMLYSLVRQCRKYPCRPAQEKFCWTLKLFDGICLYCPNFRDRVYIQGTFYFLGPYWSLLVCNVF